MKTLTFLFAALLIACNISAQPQWNGAGGLTFGMSKAKTKSICTQKGAKMGSSVQDDRLVFHDMPIGTEISESMLCYFVDDKLYNIIFLFSPENETYNDYLRLFIRIESIIAAKYGKSKSSERIYKGDFKDGDGSDKMTLLISGDLKLKESWQNRDNLNEVQVGIAHVITGLEQPYVILSYSDAALTLKASIKDENKNRKEF